MGVPILSSQTWWILNGKLNSWFWGYQKPWGNTQELMQTDTLDLQHPEKRQFCKRLALLNETYGCVWKWSISIMWPSIGKMMINKGGFGVPFSDKPIGSSRVLSFHPQIISQLLQCHIHTPSHPCSNQNHMHYASRLWLYGYGSIPIDTVC